MTLDLKTLYLISAVVTLSAAGAAILTWYHHRDAPGLRPWASALLLVNIGALLIRVVGPYTDFNVTLAANTLIVAGFALIWASLYLANRNRAEPAPLAGLVAASGAAFVALFVAASAMGAGLRTSSVLFSTFIGGFALASAYETWRGAARDGLQSRRPTALAFAGLAAARLIRAGVASLEIASLLDGSVSVTIQGYMLYASIVFVLAITYGLILMANERTLLREEALLKQADPSPRAGG